MLHILQIEIFNGVNIPYENCNTVGNKANDIGKHLKYRFHLNESGKADLSLDNDDEYRAISRRNIYQHGILGVDTYFSNGDVFRNDGNKTWNCTICNHTWKTRLYTDDNACKCKTQQKEIKKARMSQRHRWRLYI